MLSQTSEYALRAMVFLAKRWSEPSTAMEIAEITHVPASYLSKILRDLARAGLVRSQRGKRGGYVLSAEPANLSLLDIVQAVDPIRRITECPRRLPEHCPRLCPLHHFLGEQVAHLHARLQEMTVGQLLSGSPAIFP